MTSADLLRAAELAKPPAASGKYGALMPAINALRANRFSVRQAVSWCVEKGALDKKEEQKAYIAIARRLQRQELAETAKGSESNHPV